MSPRISSRARHQIFPTDVTFSRSAKRATSLAAFNERGIAGLSAVSQRIHPVASSGTTDEADSANKVVAWPSGLDIAHLALVVCKVTTCWRDAPMNLRIVVVLLVALSVPWPAHAQGAPGILRAQGCLRCHTVGTDGTGRDLTDRLVANYTVPALAAAVWNHSPTMWAEASSTGLTQPAPTEAQWEEVFRFLYTLQFSDRPALARQGGRVFESKCASCHGAGAVSTGPGKPIQAWDALEDPLALVNQMWNHASSMKKEFTGNHAWKTLSAADLLNLTAYVQSVQKVPRREQVSLPDPAEGGLLTAQHCGACHGGSDAFAAMVHNKTLMDLGAAAWNHVPLLESVPVLSRDDFKKIVAYVWELQYRGPHGVASRGERVFDTKGCISCHRSPLPSQRAQSPHPGKTFTPLSMIALSWGPGREMHRQMQEKGVRWPRLSPDDMANLVAYLNTLSR
jgi:mono/diheme cytochrome c family protein